MLRKNKLTKNIIQEQVKVKALKALFCLVIKRYSKNEYLVLTYQKYCIIILKN